MAEHLIQAGTQEGHQGHQNFQHIVEIARHLFSPRLFDFLRYWLDSGIGNIWLYELNMLLGETLAISRVDIENLLPC